MMRCLFSGLVAAVKSTPARAGFEQAAVGTSVPNSGDWIWLVVGCVVFLAAVFAAFRARKSSEGATSPALYGQSSAMQKLAVLGPVAEQVRAQHRLSSFGFDICPENIHIVRGRAILRLRSATLRGDGMMALSPGFSAPERDRKSVV